MSYEHVLKVHIDIHLVTYMSIMIYIYIYLFIYIYIYIYTCVCGCFYFHIFGIFHPFFNV